MTYSKLPPVTNGSRIGLLITSLVVLGACNPFAKPSSLEPMTLDAQDGSVRVERDGDVLEVTGRFSLEPGDVIKTVRGGARLQLQGQRRAWIKNESRVRIQDGRTLQNLSGSVLVRAKDRTLVVFDDVTASSSDGTFRVDRASASSSAATYRGVMELRAPGQERVMVTPLFAASSPAGQVLDLVPYEVDPNDSWDRLELSGLVELEEELQEFSRALSVRLEDQTLTESYFAGLAEESVPWMKPYVGGGRSAADLLIAFTIARLDPDSSLRSGFANAFELRDDEAPWGVVATVMGVDSESLIVQLESIVSETGIATGGRGGAFTLAPDSDEPVGPGPDRALRPSAGGCKNIFDCLLDSPSQDERR
jgi:hypothetical protein